MNTEKLKGLFHSLAIGDLIRYSCSICNEAHEGVILVTNEDEKGFFLEISEGISPLPAKSINPLRWNKMLGCVVDKNGEVFALEDLEIERGEGISMVYMFNTRPCSSKLSSHFTEEEMLSYTKSKEGSVVEKNIRMAFGSDKVESIIDAVAFSLQGAQIEATLKNVYTVLSISAEVIARQKNSVALNLSRIVHDAIVSSTIDEHLANNTNHTKH